VLLGILTLPGSTKGAGGEMLTESRGGSGMGNRQIKKERMPV
jgi:hypothetical protein